LESVRILSEEVVGKHVFRLIPSRYPTIQIFEQFLDPQELEMAYELEAITNDRLREEAGEIAHIPPEERITGPGCSVVMAAFTHTGIESRFSSGTYGVFYAGLDIQTSIEESKAGQFRFLSATAEPPFEITMRSYATRIALPLLDIRGLLYDHCHIPNDWATAQAFGQESKNNGENGLWYRSVRNPDGECVAAFRTLAVEPVTQTAHYRFSWDGNSIAKVFEIKEIPSRSNQ
jgi:hypothetical protein